MEKLQFTITLSLEDNTLKEFHNFMQLMWDKYKGNYNKSIKILCNNFAPHDSDYYEFIEKHTITETEIKNSDIGAEISDIKVMKNGTIEYINN